MVELGTTPRSSVLIVRAPRPVKLLPASLPIATASSRESGSGERNSLVATPTLQLTSLRTSSVASTCISEWAVRMSPSLSAPTGRASATIRCAYWPA